MTVVRVAHVFSCQMNIHQALSDIAEIRAQLDRTESYRGFRSATVGVSVLVLMLGAWVQSRLENQPLEGISLTDQYLLIWFWVAVVSAAMAIAEMWVRARVSGNRMVGRMHLALAGQIAPCLVVGFVVTLLVGMHAFEANQIGRADTSLIWALPGLWSMVYSLGLLNCRSHLPRQVVVVAVYFLLVGVFLLAYSWRVREAAGWQMLVSFGVGQALLSLILYWNLERHRDGRG